MTKQTQIVFVLAIIVALVVGWLGGRWYAGYQIEHQMDKLTEDFEDYMDELSGSDGEFDADDILDLSDLDEVSDKLFENVPVPYNDIFCDYDDQSILAGDTYYDGCNWCSCQDDGSMLCTERACETE